MTIRKETRSIIHGLGLALVVLLNLASPLLATTVRASLVPGVLADAPPDSLLILLPPRGADLVRQDLTAAEAREGAGNADLVSAQGRLGEAKAQLNVRRSEIETIKAKIKLAKEQKNQTEQVNLEQQVKAKELQVKILDARAEMRDGEVGLAHARRQAAQTQAGFLKKELELLGKRDDLSKLKTDRDGRPNLDGLVRLQAEIRDLERRCLEILKDVAEKDKSAAEDESILLGRRLRLHEAQRALLDGSRK